MAIGGYTTAVMSHYHHTNLILTLPLAFAIAFACGVVVGIPALRCQVCGEQLIKQGFGVALAHAIEPNAIGIARTHSLFRLWRK